MAETAPVLLIGPSIALGLIIGIYESLVIHRDVTIPAHRFGHMIHALILSIVLVFCTMNAAFVLNLIPAIKNIPLLGTTIGIQAAIGIIATIKIHGVSRALKSGGSGPGLGETWFHSIIVGALIVAAPYIYPIVSPSLPKWIRF